MCNINVMNHILWWKHSCFVAYTVEVYLCPSVIYAILQYFILSLPTHALNFSKLLNELPQNFSAALNDCRIWLQVCCNYGWLPPCKRAHGPILQFIGSKSKSGKKVVLTYDLRLQLGRKFDNINSIEIRRLTFTKFQLWAYKPLVK